MKRLVIIDSYALAHRAFYALPPLVSPQGILVNALYGFLLIFWKMVTELKPDYIVATFDVAGPTFRHKEYKQYKATRAPAPDNFYSQIPLIKEALTAFSVPIIEKAGYEADDIIGSLVNQLSSQKDIEIIIVSGDLDTLQLVGNNVKVYTLRKGLQDTVIYDVDKVVQRYGLQPRQIIDFKALKGDPSDNIPGVPGIGEKTAIKLIQEFGSLDNLYSAIETGQANLSPKLKEKLQQHKETAYFSRHLVAINKNLQLDFDLSQAQVTEFSAEKIRPLLEKWGFRSLEKRIFNTSEHRAVSSSSKFSVVKKENLLELSKKLNLAQQIGLFLDYSGENWKKRNVKGLLISLPQENFYINKEALAQFSQLDIEWNSKTLITANAKVLYQEFSLFQDCLFEDLEILAWLLDSERKNYQIPHLAAFYLHKDISSDLSSWGNILFSLYQVINAKLETLNLRKVYCDIEQPLIPILAQMEQNGILVNKKQLQRLTQKIENDLTKLRQEIYLQAGKEFNINSPLQLSQVLFGDLHLPPQGLRKTSTGRISTDAQALSKLRGKHPIIDLLLQYRTLEKLRSSFGKSLLKYVDEDDSKIHTCFRQTGTATGRISSESPNLQNIPWRGRWGQEIRKVFISSPSFQLCSLDYSQIELRLAAHLSQDSLMKQIFAEDRDIHTMTASYIFQVSPEKVTPEMRRTAKILNFGIIYGMSDKSFAETSGISLKEAKLFREKYFSQFIGLKLFLDDILAKARKLGYVETLLGRKRFLPLIGAPGRRGREEERMALNMPFQGLAADIIKIAMIKVYNWIKEQRLTEQVKIILQIHDELLLEVKSGLIKEVVPQIKKIMEQAYPLSVPLKVTAKAGSNWGALKKI